MNLRVNSQTGDTKSPPPPPHNSDQKFKLGSQNPIVQSFGELINMMRKSQVVFDDQRKYIFFDIRKIQTELDTNALLLPANKGQRARRAVFRVYIS